MWYQTHETIDGEHGRIETRRTTILPLMYLHAFKLKWKGLQSIARVENQRQIGKHTSRESRYYITSLPSDAKRMALPFDNTGLLKISCIGVKTI